MPPAKRHEPQKTKQSPSFQKEDFAKQHPSKMGVPKQAESPQRGKVTGGSQNEAGGEILPEQPSTTITAPTRSAWEDVGKARTEYERITTTYSRLRTIYNISPYNGYSIFAGILDSSHAQEIFDMIRGAHDSITRMAQIASGDTESEESLRMEYAKVMEAHRKPAQEETVAKETEGQESPGTETAEEAPAYDTSELFDYLKKRYFWRTENEIYNTSRSMYVRRNCWVSTIIANRSNFEAEEHEGFWARAAKWAATIGTRDEALKYIDKVQGMYLPQVPHHESGEENRHLLIPDTNSHLDALERSRLPEIQEAYIKVIDNKDAALKTAEVLKDVAEYTKTASEMIISTGATIVTGGNPAAEALINGLYSGALSVAEQASSSSIAEGEFNKAKAELDASGMDPGSEEYKQALQALQTKREASEINWWKVAADAGTSAITSAAPGIGKWAKGTKYGKIVTGKIGAAGNWIKNTSIAKRLGSFKGAISKFGDSIKGKAGKIFGNVKGAVSKFGKNIRGKAGEFFGKAKSTIGGFARKKWAQLAESSGGRFAGKMFGTIGGGIKNLGAKLWGRTKGFFGKISGGEGGWFDKTLDFLTENRAFRNTRWGQSLSSKYHSIFDRFSNSSLAKKELGVSRRAHVEMEKAAQRLRQAAMRGGSEAERKAAMETAWNSYKKTMANFGRDAGEYAAKREAFREIGEKGLKYGVMSDSKSGIRTYGKELFKSLWKDDDGNITDLADKIAKDQLGISLKNPLGISATNPLDAAQEVLTDFTKNKAQQLGHSILPFLVDEPDEFDFKDAIVGQYVDTDVFRKLPDNLSKREALVLLKELDSDMIPDSDMGLAEDPDYNFEEDPDYNFEEDPDYIFEGDSEDGDNSGYEEDSEYDFSEIDLSDMFTDE